MLYFYFSFQCTYRKTIVYHKRRSPDINNQDVNSDKIRPTTPTNDVAPNSNPSSPTKSSASATSQRNSIHNTQQIDATHNYETTFDLDGNIETASLTSSREGNR